MAEQENVPPAITSTSDRVELAVLVYQKATEHHWVSRQYCAVLHEHAIAGFFLHDWCQANQEIDSKAFAGLFPKRTHYANECNNTATQF